MHFTLRSVRLFFLIISTVFATSYALSLPAELHWTLALVAGICGGGLLALMLFGLEKILEQMDLKALFLGLAGLSLGYAFSAITSHFVDSILLFSNETFPPIWTSCIHNAIFLMMAYLSTTTLMRWSDRIHLSIPFIRLREESSGQRDLLLDSTALQDPRLVDLASTGVLDKRVVVAKCLVRHFQHKLNSTEEVDHQKAKRALDNLGRLENLPDLEVRYSEVNFSQPQQGVHQLLGIARATASNILSGDMATREHAGSDVKVIYLNALAAALKPLTPHGEELLIKVQRYGKEHRQGVGYLEDGTMVVINGGAEYLGDTIRVQVVSVKHSSAGRIVFTNTIESEEPAPKPKTPSRQRLQTADSGF